MVPEIFLLLSIQDGESIVCSTERFFRTGPEPLSIWYQEFNGHAGFSSRLAENRHLPDIVNIKSDGNFAGFNLKKKDGTIISWMIPTGFPGFAFWNVTNRFEFVGRRYEIVK